MASAPPIQFLESINSTNLYLVERARSCIPFQTVATQNQTAGRGRLGRIWHTSPGLGLAVSIALPLLPGAPSIGLHPLVVGTSVLHFLRNEGLASAQMKWPNDILVGGRKVAGILCEITDVGLVIGGIGMNLFHGLEELPHHSATSLALEGIDISDVREFTGRIVESLVEGWNAARFRDGDWSDWLSPNVGTIGEEVRVVDNSGESWDGVAVGIDDDGHLLVRRTRDNELRVVVAADVMHLRQ